MAETTVPSALAVKQWDDNFFTEYIRDNRFARYMGTSENAAIQMREQGGKRKGDTIYFELVNRLQGSGKTNNQTLEGFEEDLSQRSFPITVNLYRHGVVVPEYEEYRTAIDLRNAARVSLKNWATEQVRDKIITKLGSISTNGTTHTAYASASEADKDTWLTNNADRVLFGASKSNGSSNDHSAALANVDSTTDKLTPAAVSLMKRMAKTANPKIRPIKVNGDEEWYVLFCNSLAFRDIKENSTMTQANREARVRGENNPLFTDGDLLWDGVIIREIPEIGVYSGVGASSIDVGPVYMLGAQAIAYALAQRWTTRTQDRDYQSKNGVAIQQIYEADKIYFGTGASDTTTPKQYGVLTGYFSAVADA